MESSKYDKLVKSLTDLDIALVDINNEYRSTYDIMKDIADKWDGMTSMEQAALAETIAGTRQQAAFFSLINNFQEASGAMEAMADSAGALEDAYDTYLDSTTAHINQFKASWQALGADLFNSDFLSWIVDIGAHFVDILDSLTKMNLLIPALITGGLVKRLITISTTTAAEAVTAKKITASILQQKTITDQLSLSVAGLNAKQIALVQSTIQQSVATNTLTAAQAQQLSEEVGLIATNSGVIASNTATAASFRAVAASIPGWGILLMTLTAVVGVIGDIAHSAEELQQKFSEDSAAIKDEIGALEEYKKQIQEIESSEATQAERLNELNKIRETLNDTFDSNIARTESETQTVAALNKELEEEIKNRRDLYLSTNEDAYNKAVYRSKDFESESWHLGGYRNYKTIMDFGVHGAGLYQTNVSENIKSLFGRTENGGFVIGQNAKNEIELLKEYENVLNRIYEIRVNRQKLGQDLNKQETALYNTVKERYKELSDDISSNGYDYSGTIAVYAQKKAEKLIAEIEQGTMTTEEWRDKLISMANGDEYVIDAINELIQDTAELPEVVVDALDEINNAIESINEQLDSLNENMMAAKDYFEDLAKTIKDNDDADKFFSSAEIIDLLDKYPELSNAILETTYGYKIEAEALETLRQQKLKEQKDALASQIVETESAIESVQKRLDAYAKEIEGVKTLEEAKVELAKLDAQLAQVNSLNLNAGLADAWTTSIEKRKKALSGWVETSNELEKLSQSLKKSKMQYTVLGNVFDDVKDSANDATSALNKQKDAIKDLSDEYKDAKDAIEDLIKLTMDMIKKQKALEKSALKEQLDNFKKLIEKRKDLIDLQKEELSFQKQLSEQNRDLLAIQQELDALSIEGANYSLEDMKRKAELEQKLVEQQDEYNEFLYEHEVDLRKSALDEEMESFENKTNAQIKAIEDYLDHEGKIRQDAIDLINGKTEQFYNDLLDYTMNYTDKARWEFDQLWTKAYDALYKYGNGVIDVDATLAYLAGRIAQIEAEMEALDNAINNAKATATSFTDGVTEGMEGVVKVTEEAIDKMNQLANASANAVSWATQARDPRYYDTGYTATYQKTVDLGNAERQLSNLPLSDKLKELILTGVKYKKHTGGIVEAKGITRNGEVLAKLMAGEVVVTPNQAANFLSQTLPKLMTASNITNNSSPTINIGDINIAGDATDSTIAKLKEAQKDIVDSVFKTINNQKKIFNNTGYVF